MHAWACVVPAGQGASAYVCCRFVVMDPYYQVPHYTPEPLICTNATLCMGRGIAPGGVPASHRQGPLNFGGSEGSFGTWPCPGGCGWKSQGLIKKSGMPDFIDVSLNHAAMSGRCNQPRQANPLTPKKKTELQKSRHVAAYSTLEHRPNPRAKSLSQKSIR